MTLDCSVINPSQSIIYEWMNPQGNIISSQFLPVFMEGIYSCRAATQDFPNNTDISVIECKWLTFELWVIYRLRIMHFAQGLTTLKRELTIESYTSGVHKI